MNKKVIVIIVFLILVVSLLMTFKVMNNKDNNGNKELEGDSMINEIMLIVNNYEFKVKLENNSSSREFVKKLEEKDIVVNAHDYGNFEKVGDLGFDLPTNDKNITTKPGDIILYQGHEITVYYDENTWNFTKLGEIIDTNKEELKSILGQGNVILTFKIK